MVKIEEQIKVLEYYTNKVLTDKKKEGYTNVINLYREKLKTK